MDTVGRSCSGLKQGHTCCCSCSSARSYCCCCCCKACCGLPWGQWTLWVMGSFQTCWEAFDVVAAAVVVVVKVASSCRSTVRRTPA